MTNNLVDFLKTASDAYYSGNPIITDEVFDSLADSINFEEVGTSKGTEVPHLYKLYSLKKCYPEDGDQCVEDIKKYVRSPKLDGAAISILYVDGMLSRALTRGDGIKGTDITEKFLGTSLVPKEIPCKLPTQINGEVVAPKLMENARNYASGALSLKDVEEFKTRALSFIAYGIQPYVTSTYEQDIHVLHTYGFNTVLDCLWEEYDQDGLVFRVNSNSAYEAAGFTSHHPRGAIAVKQRGVGVITTIKAVEWQTGKTGKVTPVAILEPINIGGAIISRATLNNPGFIETLDISLGDRVEVIKAGEIIPCIVRKV